MTIIDPLVCYILNLRAINCILNANLFFLCPFPGTYMDTIPQYLRVSAQDDEKPSSGSRNKNITYDRDCPQILIYSHFSSEFNYIDKKLICSIKFNESNNFHVI